MKVRRQPLRTILLCFFVTPLLLIAACQQPTLEYPAAYHEYAYVTNGKSNDVSVIDMRSFKTLKTISVGKGPTGVASSPTRNEVYVVDSESNDLRVIDAERNVAISTIALGRTPYFVDVSTNG